MKMALWVSLGDTKIISSDTWSLWSSHTLNFPTLSQQGTVGLWLPCHGSLYRRDPCPVEFQLEPKRLDKLGSLYGQWVNVKTPSGPNTLGAIFDSFVLAVEKCLFSIVIC